MFCYNDYIELNAVIYKVYSCKSGTFLPAYSALQKYPALFLNFDQKNISDVTKVICAVPFNN